MILACSTCFALEKQGSAPLEWEDAAAYHDGDPAAGVEPRFVVVDGATEAYDAIRWVEHLVASFVAHTGPAITHDALGVWFEQVQRLWAAEAPARFATVIERHKFLTEGSFATFLGCRLADLDGPGARWEAAALGDTVLFHIRDGRLLSHFPPIGVDEFGLSPAGVGTRPEALDPMLRDLELGAGEVRAGDVLFVATDALAQWLLVEAARDESSLWWALAALDHDAAFAAIVADQRAAGRLHNDDVTLLRVRLLTEAPGDLVMCL
ncbi:conserved hypothetical protein [Frankia canadensis]|uniref:Uncharacterized protein n=1 Tax=Frankia canadensis TaxID=1836972 RepID=A0A2I2KUY4_9ACTN|nr:hypothetical protein [Frankia canadensis]SNQ49465.1 conserved hypothetical protein [Frankia canadensis]SOU56755.1 conserved hypothetical protein [Frankia canadensis]